MDKPAKEPLYVGEETSGDVDGFAIHCQKAAPHHFVPLYAIAFSEEDAIRIVACVNACAGIDNETLLHAGVVQRGELVDSLRRLDHLQAALSATVGQRDQLLAEMKKAAEQIRRSDYTPARSTLLEAIAAVERPAKPEPESDNNTEAAPVISIAVRRQNGKPMLFRVQDAGVPDHEVAIAAAKENVTDASVILASVPNATARIIAANPAEV